MAVHAWPVLKEYKNDQYEHRRPAPPRSGHQACGQRDLAAQLNLPVILVVGMRLGCISHALLTVEAIVNRGLVLAGWVANTADPDMRFERENIEALAQRIPAPLLGHVPRLQEPTAAAAAEFIDLAGLPGWPSTRGQS